MSKINQISGCFSDELANRLRNVVVNSHWSYGWRSSLSMGHGHWNHDFAGGGTENSIDCSANLKEPELQDAWKYLKAKYFPNAVLLRCYANGHTYGIEGYPHTDSERAYDQTMVVYLNKHWRREWGGETVLYNGNNIEFAQVPEFNKALIFFGTQEHAAKAVSRICPDLRMTLMFKFSLVSDIARDKIQRFFEDIGANRIEHGDSRLNRHLLRCYDLAKAANQSDVVCKAAALHSIFGTNHFKTVTVNIANKQVIGDLIGDEALKLVELFHQIDRPRAFEFALEHGGINPDLMKVGGGMVSVTPTQFDQLCAIEAVNMLDQCCLSQYPKLAAKWSKLKG